MWPFRKQLPRLAQPVRLHIGCGENIYRGWINIDREALAGVDHVLDVRQGLPFEHVAAIYAEHFLEHLSFDDGLLFLHECRRLLSAAGVLRVSTPNLDWVLKTHYRLENRPGVEAELECLRLNRAFHGWGHQFLYNREMLTRVLQAVGFAGISYTRYGESGVAELRGLERHEQFADSEDLPHVLIAEATGDSEPLEIPEAVLHEYRQAFRPGEPHSI